MAHRKKLGSMACGLALVALGAGAAEEFVQHGTHVHGEALLNVVVDGSDVVIELESPAANIIGFEHAPKNAEQEAAVETAMASLARGNDLFQWPSGGLCRLMGAAVESPFDEAQGEEGHGEKDHHHGGDHDEHHDDHHDEDHGDHHDDKHGDHHDKDHGDDHGHDDDHAHHGEESHSDVRAEYRYGCRRPDALSELKVALFEAFPGMERLRVQYIVNDSQGAAQLTPGKNVVEF